MTANPSQFQSVLEADLAALGLPKTYRRRYVVTHRIAYYQRLLRLTESRRNPRGPWNKALYYMTRLRLEFVGERMGFDIPAGVFGPGLSIAHRGMIVVNGRTRVGKGCRIHPGVTIGDVDGGVPVIEDNVFIGPNCGVYGAVRVGRGSMLGPHALVNIDVPAGSLVVASRGTVSERRRGLWVNPNALG